ncbi:MAG TPA: GNAT family protein [Acidimicrobiales bacterium]|nr:GNAT family protein [Acidimicrobiales bacterium]
MIPGRLTRLRPVERRDLPLLQELANDPTIGSLVVGWDFPVSMHGQEQWLEHSTATPTTVRLMVDDAETSTPVGLTGLWDIDWHNRSALTAVKLRPDCLGRGMGTDAVMTVMAWAFYVVGLRRLHSWILPFNEASVKTYVGRCGWKVEGRDREAIFRKGEWVDLLRVGVLRSDFDEHSAAVAYIDNVCPTDVEDISMRGPR